MPEGEPLRVVNLEEKKIFISLVVVFFLIANKSNLSLLHCHNRNIFSDTFVVKVKVVFLALGHDFGMKYTRNELFETIFLLRLLVKNQGLVRVIFF